VFTRDVAPGIHRVEDAFTNWYVVEDADTLTIVDCGVPRSWRSLQASLRELGRGRDAIKAVALTHGGRTLERYGTDGALAATGAGVVLCGHGEPWRDGAAACVARARAAGSS
jgi:hypothetical protein